LTLVKGVEKKRGGKDKLTFFKGGKMPRIVRFEGGVQISLWGKTEKVQMGVDHWGENWTHIKREMGEAIIH